MPAATAVDLHGLSILVVEDVALIADLVVEALQSAGCRVVGPAARLDQGLTLARTDGLAGALLDVNLAGEHCFPIAHTLAARGVPFVFLTGYDERLLPRRYRDVPRLLKPFDFNELLGLIERQFR
jgi:DNA-binding response OmpR family regulator